MAKSDSTAQSTDGTNDLTGLSAIELLAKAGDENARASLGQGIVNAATPLRELDGFTVGEPAKSDVFADLDGKIVKSGDAGTDGFRGTQLFVKGTAVTAAALSAYAAASS